MRNLAILWLVIGLYSIANAQYCTPATSTTAITPSSSVQNTATYPAGTAPVFTFTATAGCTYNFTTCGLSTTDTYIRLYNSSITFVQGWDDQCGLQTNATWTCPTSGSYSVQLSQFVCQPLFGSATMSYSVSCPTPPCSNPVVDAGPDQIICAGSSATLNGTVTAGSGGSGGSGSALVVTISGPSWLDMVSWTLTNAAGTQIGSGGPYASGSTNTVTIASPGAGPYSFYLETLGIICDNTANYTISCNGTTVSSGSVGPCLSTTVSVAGCTGSPSTAPITYVWSPAATLSATNILNPTATPSATTTYTLTATQGTCSGQDQVTVFVTPLPVVDAGPDLTTCGGSVTLNGSASATGGFSGPITINVFSGSNLDETSWTLTNSLGAIIGSGGPYATGSNNTITIPAPTSPPYTFSIETQGPSNSNVAAYNVMCGTTSLIGGIQLITGGQTTSMSIAGCAGSVSPVVSWSPSATLSNASILNPVASPSTTTTYTLTATANGCTNQDQMTVNIGSSATLSVNNATICSGQSATLTASSPSAGGVFNWTASGQTGATITVSPTVSTTYDVTYTLNGCTTAPVTANVTVNPAPTVSCTSVDFCPGSTVTLTASGSPSGGTYLWAPGNFTGNSISVSPGATTAYNVQYDIPGCGTADTTIYANLIDIVDWANIQWPGVSTICEGTSLDIYGQVYEPGLTEAPGQAPGISVAFGISTVDTDPATWPASSWNTAIYNNNMAVNPNNDEYQATLSGLSAGTYYYSFSYTYNGCTVYGGYNANGGDFWDGVNFVNGVVTVTPNATPNFAAVNAICQGGTLSQLPSSSLNNISGTWSPALNNQQTTTYTFTPSSGICATTSTLSITVNPVPNSGITNNSNTTELNCNQTSISITATGVGNYSWSNNGNIIGSNAALAITNPGDYQLTVTNSYGCQSSLSIQITQDTITPIISLSASANELNCNISSINLSATGATTYTWSNATGVLGSASVLQVSSPGTYTVTGADPNGCSMSLTQVITQNVQIPSATINNLSGTTVLNCSQTSINLSATGGQSYSWSNGSNVILSSSNLSISSPGTYTLTVTGANGCTNTSTINITQSTVSPVVNTINLSNSNILTCSLTSIDLVASGGGTYAWSNGTTNLGTTSQLTVSAPGTYTVTVTGANGCTTTNSTTITQNITAPTAAITTNPNSTMLSCTNNSLTLLASGGGSYLWVSGTTTIGNTSSISINTAGTYDLTVTAANGCSATQSITITQNTQAPVVSISATANGTIDCNNTSIILTGASSTFSGTATWLNANTVLSTGPISGAGNVSNLTVSSPGIYTLNILESNGCIGTAAYTVLIDTLSPVASITNTSNTTVLNCNQTNIALTANGASSYVWSNTTGNVGNTASLNVISAGTYTVVATSTNGCSSTQQLTITQDTLSPTATISNSTGATELTCSLTSINLSATGGDTYSWSNGSNIVGNNSSLVVNSPGTYTVTVAANSNGCTQTSSIVITQNIQLPNITITPNPNTTELNCTTTSIDLSANGAVSYSWALGTTNLGSTNSLLVNAPGTYNVSGIGSNGCTASATCTITQNLSPPNVVINNTPNTSELDCNTTTITIQATGGVSYSWSNGSNVIGTNPSTTINSPGIYTVTVTGSNGCVATQSTSITQDISLPTPAITNNSAITELTCVQTSISLSASGGSSYTWANGSAAVGALPSLSVTAPGTYILTATGLNGCTANDTIVITQNVIQPSASISNQTQTNTLDCNTTSISLLASGGLSYYWSNAVGFISSAPNLTVSMPALYQVIVTASNGCTDTTQILIGIQANTNPVFTQIAPVCTGTAFALPTTSNNGVNGSWSPALNFNNTTTYTFTPNTGLCANTASMTVVVNPYPTVSATNDTICDGNTGVIQTQVSLIGGNYLWLSNSSTQASLSISPNTTTSYSVIYNLAGCADTATAQIFVNPVPSIQVQNGTICEGQTGSLSVSANMPNGQFLWSTGSTNDTITLSPLSTISETVTYTLNGCTSSAATATLTVNVVPQLAINNQTICAGDPVTLVANANPSGVFYWGATAIQGLSSNTFSPSQDTTLAVFNVLNGCSSDTLFATVTVTPLPISSFSADALQGCAPFTSTFTADFPSYSSYIWQTSDLQSANGNQSTFDFDNAGNYAVTLSVTENGCSSSTTINNIISVDNYPVAAFEPSAQVFTQPNQTLSFWNNSFGASSYLWNFGDGGSSLEEGPTYTFNVESQGVLVTLIAFSPLGCADSTSFFIEFDPGLVYYIPNSFTPDGDQFNQTFLPIFTTGIDPYNFQLLIYNRWGEVVFESLDPSIGWDGSFGPQGNPCQNGTYTYMITVKLPSIDERRSFYGHVNLIR